MENEIIGEQDKQFIKGFNNGYLIAEHEPELANQLVKNPNTHSEYFEGIVLGKQEHDMEKVRERLRGVDQNDTQDKDIRKDRGRDK